MSEKTGKVGPELPSNSTTSVSESVRSDNSTRAGERWIIVVALVLPSIVTYFYFVAFGEGAAKQQYFVFSFGKTVQFLLPVAWMYWAARWRIRFSRPGTTGWLASLSMSAAVFVAIVLLYRMGLSQQSWFAKSIDEVQAKVAVLGCDRLAPYLLLACFYSIVHSLLEEYYWRWFVFDRLRNHVSLVAAIAISSLGFMAHHVIVLAKYFQGLSPATIFFSVCVAAGGAFWAWLYNRSGSLWPSWFGHAVVDAAIFFVGYQMVFAP